MTIEYRETKDFAPKDLEELFRSVNWESANYPEKLAAAMKNSSNVISAWDGETLVGLARGLSDGVTIAFIHYILVNPQYQGLHIGDELMKRLLAHWEDLLYVKVIPSDPKTMPFYARFGFREYDNYSAMVIKRL